MASIGMLKRPILAGVGGCPDLNWYKLGSSISICPNKLVIYSDYAFSNYRLSLRLNGGTKIGDTCATTSDAYVTTTFFGMFEVDIWKAYRDSIWTSSVALTVYALLQTGYGPNINIKAAKWKLGNTAYDTVTKSVTPTQVGSPSCPGDGELVATVTVTDKGVLTIA